MKQPHRILLQPNSRTATGRNRIAAPLRQRLNRQGLSTFVSRRGGRSVVFSSRFWWQARWWRCCRYSRQAHRYGSSILRRALVTRLDQARVGKARLRRGAHLQPPLLRKPSGPFHPCRFRTRRSDLYKVQELELLRRGKLSGVWLQVQRLQHSALSALHPEGFHSISFHLSHVSANRLLRRIQRNRCSVAVNLRSQFKLKLQGFPSLNLSPNPPEQNVFKVLFDPNSSHYCTLHALHQNQ